MGDIHEFVWSFTTIYDRCSLMDTVARLNFLIFDGIDDNWWIMLPHGHRTEVEFYEIRWLFMMIEDRRALIDIVARSNLLYFDSTDDDG